MKKRAAKASLILLETLALLLAVGAAGAAFLYWRLEQGPVSLALLKPSAELAIARRLPKEYAAEIDHIDLVREGGGDYAVRISGWRILDPEKNEAASATETTFRFDAGDVFAGKVGPKLIQAEGARFRIVRDRQRRIEIPAARRRERKPSFASLSPIFDGRILKSAFEQAKIDNADIIFVDIASGRSWTSQNAAVSINRTEKGLNAAVSGNIDMNGSPAAVKAAAQYTEKSGIVSVDIDGANFPIGDILTTFYGDRAAFIDAPVTGEAVISFTSRGKVLSSRFSANIDKGALHIGGRTQAIKFIKWNTTFDPEKNRFEIENFSFDAGGNSGALTGTVSLAFADDIRTPETLSFDLNGADLTANIPDILPESLPINAASVSGAYQVSGRKISLNHVDLSLLDIDIAGKISMAFPHGETPDARVSPEVKVDLAVDGALDPKRLLRIWPLGVAMGARDWIEERVEAAVINNVHATMDLPAGAVGEDGAMPDEALTVAFDVSNGKAYYIEQMTPLTAGVGKGVLHGNSFKLSVDRARVGDVAISSGEVDIPIFIPRWRPTYIRFTAAGRSEAMLGILNQEPLTLLSKINLQPDQFKGDARARVEIMRPNKLDVLPEEYRYSGKASFENMEIVGLVGDVDLANAHGEVDLKPRSMTVTTDARLSDAPIDIVWRQNFFAQDGPSTLSASGEIDSSTGDLFGVSSRQFLRGPVAFKADATGDLGAFKTLNVTADFTHAALTVDAFGWRKPMDAPATGDIKIDFSPDEIAIQDIALDGEGVEVKGDLTFGRDGALRRADLPKLYFKDAADLAVKAQRNPAGELVVTAVGKHLNAGPIIEGFVEGANEGGGEGGPIKWGRGVSLSARIDSMTMRKGVEYRVASLDLWRDAERLQALDFTAFDHDGPPLTVTMALTGEEKGPRQTITAQSEAIGTLLRGVFGLTSVSGGKGSMLVNLREPGQKGFSGELEARDLKIVQAPLLARIFSAGSLEGLANLLNGEGIDLSYAFGKFDFSNGVLSLNDMRATGPSVGITADGAVGMGENGEISLNGAVAPIYQLNSILGKAPIIGDLLVGKKGEGVLALSYSVTGQRAAPTVFVNPLSALTPGIFRRLFEPQRAAPSADNEENAKTPAEDGARK